MELEHYETEAKTKPTYKDGSAERSRSSSPISSDNNNNNTGVDASGSTDAGDISHRTHSSPHYQSGAETPAGKREGMQLRLRGS